MAGSILHQHGLLPFLPVTFPDWDGLDPQLKTRMHAGIIGCDDCAGETIYASRLRLNSVPISRPPSG